MPQCPKTDKWVNVTWSNGQFSLEKTPVTPSLKTAWELLRDVMKNHPVDPDRVYVTGQSMGGYATWYSILANPDLFAAAIPICGGGDPESAKNIRSVAVWAFHGDNDKTVPPSGSRSMVEALKKLGAPVKYTEFPGVGHVCMPQAWATPGIMEWLFAQKRTTGK